MPKKCLIRVKRVSFGVANATIATQSSVFYGSGISSINRNWKRTLFFVYTVSMFLGPRK